MRTRFVFDKIAALTETQAGWPMKALSIALILMFSLSGCGRKGPLQPPPDEHSANTAAEQTASQTPTGAP
ncbi:lipoprotein [Thiomicrospira sp. WB1]|uniref:LPS translocon maturation chaperone LptM n=1 Tax=Thiomicrospira sp. WB1 TaxID=1685380 RepID=UPI0009EC2491